MIFIRWCPSLFDLCFETNNIFFSLSGILNIQPMIDCPQPQPLSVAPAIVYVSIPVAQISLGSMVLSLGEYVVEEGYIRGW